MVVARGWGGDIRLLFNDYRFTVPKMRVTEMHGGDCCTTL
jgi:hypothetical protein